MILAMGVAILGAILLGVGSLEQISILWTIGLFTLLIGSITATYRATQRRGAGPRL
ncbi:hypothetical protein [Pseudonocardia sp. 73-21]|uniref:hypothetical protein n=1 Tax=Pseudonocardia sp. 73-21 TaxID=1895809 RepID=UPI00260BDD99|nr:hypothetical protein [Pseudonocardia sp. 73-21]